MSIASWEQVFATYKNFLSLYRLAPATAAIRTAEWHAISVEAVKEVIEAAEAQ